MSYQEISEQYNAQCAEASALYYARCNALEEEYRRFNEYYNAKRQAISEEKARTEKSLSDAYNQAILDAAPPITLP